VACLRQSFLTGDDKKNLLFAIGYGCGLLDEREVHAFHGPKTLACDEIQTQTIPSSLTWTDTVFYSPDGTNCLLSYTPEDNLPVSVLGEESKAL
jgi:hypothetical protein